MSESKRELPVLNPDAAGIDLGADHHWVSVPADRTAQSVRRFGCFTADLYKMSQWLQECGVKTVAMKQRGFIGLLYSKSWKRRGLKSNW